MQVIILHSISILLTLYTLHEHKFTYDTLINAQHHYHQKKMGRGRRVADLAGLCGHLSGTSPALGVALPSRPRAMAAMAMAMEVSGLDGVHAVFLYHKTLIIP